MAGTVAPASPLLVPETERIAALLSELAGDASASPAGDLDLPPGDDTTASRFPDSALPAVDPAAEQLLEAAGRALGDRLAELPVDPASGSATDHLSAAVGSAFRHLGWPAPHLDFGRYDTDVLIVEVRCGPVDPVIAGLLGGLLSRLAGIELAAATMPADGNARLFVVAPPGRLEGLRR